ncbi:integrin alpha-9-like [Plodia interpunctella]|uniref:integrin alpha-9-like n=1 Tax=Plodia interpunctella TaxID=58824 RepID=UPI0023674AC3|nr:integrin alpha-9-like [Plodia interpunctella]
MKDARKTAYQNMLRNSRNLGSGLTSGQFWHMDDIVYAVSFTDSNLDGGVIFLRYKKGKLSIIMKNRKPFQLNYDDMGVSPKNIMFGAALCAATLYGNSYTDLVVGAPAQHGTSASDPEFGAIHIYKGSFKMAHFIIRKLTLISVNEESRFGSSVVANDLDGDGLQELFVSAPYQNEGVVYVLSGYEIREISKQIDENGSTDTVDVSDLKYTQIIKREGYKRLGFSIGVMSDMDSNGCDEIAIGAPASNKIMILRCIPAVTINVTTELDGPKIVPESENEFKIKTCINLEYKSNMDNIAAHVSLKNTISGTRVNITCRPKLIDIDISSKENTYCHIVNVYIVGFEPGLYTFTSEAKLITAGLENTDFNPSWVNVTPYSIMKKTQLIERGCSGEECIYHFKMNFLWSGGEIKKGYKYDVNSMKYETLTLHITNEGRIAFTACALVNVVGAPVDQLYCSHGSDGYLCRLPEGFRKNTSYDILIKLETSRLTNEFTGLNVTVNLYEECDEKNSPIKEQFYVEYDFTMDRIEVQGVSETRSITEKAIKTSSGTIDVTHTYRISNKGTVSWKDVVMDISVQESNFIKELLVTSENQCKIINQTTSCSLDLIPSSTLKIVVTIVVWKNQIEKLLLVKKLAITSNISLKLLPTTVIKTTSVTSVPVYEKDTTIGQNKSVIIIIAILVAAILFAIVIYILYRVGFFRRKQKEELQAEIKRRSVKRPNTTSQVEDSLLEINDDEIYDDQDTLLRDKGQPSSSKQPSRISTSKNVVETENAVTAEEKTKSIVSEENKS